MFSILKLWEDESLSTAISMFPVTRSSVLPTWKNLYGSMANLIQEETETYGKYCQMKGIMLPSSSLSGFLLHLIKCQWDLGENNS